MAEIEVTFHNEAEIKVQVQLFKGRMLVSTCVADAGGNGILRAASAPYDIYFKNGITGWEIVRKLDSDAKNITLRKLKGRYVISGT